MRNQSRQSGVDRNRKLIERFYSEMWNRFDKSLIPILLTEDVRFRGSLGQHRNGYAEFTEQVRLSGDSAFTELSV